MDTKSKNMQQEEFSNRVIELNELISEISKIRKNNFMKLTRLAVLKEENIYQRLYLEFKEKTDLFSEKKLQFMQLTANINFSEKSRIAVELYYNYLNAVSELLVTSEYSMQTLFMCTKKPFKYLFKYLKLSLPQRKMEKKVLEAINKYNEAING